MRASGTLIVVGLFLSVPGCGLIAGFGADKQLVDDDDPGSQGNGAGGQGGASSGGGDVGGDGGDGSGSPEYSCEPDSDLMWLRTFGDASADQVEYVAPAPDGGVYVSGMFEGAIDFGLGAMVSEGGRDYFVARLDTAGQTLWAQSYGNQYDDGHVPLLARHPGGIVMGGTIGDPVDVGSGEEHVPQGGGAAHVTMMSPDGQHVWTTWLDGPGGAHVLRLAADPITDDVIVFGAFSDTVDLGGPPLDLVSNGGNDAMLIRLDSGDGSVLDSVSWGGLKGDWGQGIEVAEDGRIFLAGSTEGDIDFGNGPAPTLGDADSYAAVLTPDFELVWARTYPDVGYQHFWDMALTPDGDMVMVGFIDSGSVDLGASGVYAGSRDGYFVRISGDDGHLVNGRLIPGIDFPKGVAVDASGDVVFAGEFEGTLVLGNESFHSVDGKGDPVIFKLSPGFQHVKWHNVFVGNEGDEGFYDMFVMDDGHVLVGGYFRDVFTADGCETREAVGGTEAVLFKRKP